MAEDKANADTSSAEKPRPPPEETSSSGESREQSSGTKAVPVDPTSPFKATSSTGSQAMDGVPLSPMFLSPTYYDDFNGDFVVYNRMPLKEICLAFFLLTLGALGIVVGAYMAYHKVWGDRSHGLIFLFLGALLFIPGFHETRIAYFAWIGYKGFSFSNMPSV